MTWEALHDCEVPVSLSRSAYVRSRERYYRALGVARDDAALPFPVPPGCVLLRRVTGYTFTRSAPSGPRVGLNGMGGGHAFYAPLFEDPASDRVVRRELVAAEPVNLWARETARAVIVPAGEIPIDALSAGHAGPGSPPAPVFGAVGFVEAWIAEGGEYAWHYVPPVRPLAELATREWLEERIPFVPPAGPTVFGFRTPLVTYELPAPDAVLVLDPHPWLEELPPAAGPVVQVVTRWSETDFRTATMRPVLSRAVLAVTGERHTIKRTPNGWLAHYRYHSSGNFFESLPGDVANGVRTLARSAAVQMVLTVGAAILTAGAAAPIAQAALASGNGAASVGAPFGADLSVGPANVSGSVSAPLAASGPSAAGTPVSEALARAAVTARAGADVAPVVRPQETNEVLAEVAKGTVYLGGFDDLVGLTFRELVITAQLTREERDRLRLELAVLKAEVDARGGAWLVGARTAWKAIRTLVLALGTAGIGTAAELALEAAQEVASAATTLLELRNARELLRIIEARVNEARLAALEARVAMANAAAEGADRAAEANVIRSEGAAPECGPWCEFVAWLRELAWQIEEAFTWRSTSTT